MSQWIFDALFKTGELRCEDCKETKSIKYFSDSIYYCDDCVKNHEIIRNEHNL